MNGLKINVDEKAGIVFIDLVGYLDAHTHEKLEELLEEKFGAGRFRYVVDLSRLEYISSAGAGVFIGAASTCQDHKGKIVLVRPTSEVQEIFELLGVSQLFPTVKDRDQALARF
jgi:anti-sigma B factor antagonist